MHKVLYAITNKYLMCKQINIKGKYLHGNNKNFDYLLLRQQSYFHLNLKLYMWLQRDF